VGGGKKALLLKQLRPRGTVSAVVQSNVKWDGNGEGLRYGRRGGRGNIVSCGTPMRATFITFGQIRKSGDSRSGGEGTGGVGVLVGRRGGNRFGTRFGRGRTRGGRRNEGVENRNVIFQKLRGRGGAEKGVDSLDASNAR